MQLTNAEPDHTTATGYVSQIQDLCVHDGDGIRTTVFLAGCPLRCRWCANPETWDITRGTPMQVAAILAKCARQRVFFNHSGGGVTLSGGEPGMQPVFVAALTAALHLHGFDVCMETSGYFDWEAMQPTLAELDMLFFDFKHPAPATHRKFTGKSNEIIKGNLIRAAQLTANLVVRLPLVPGVNDATDDLLATAEFLKTHLPNPQLEILPYHDWSRKKYDMLGLPFHEYDIPAEAAVHQAKSVIEECGVTIVDYK